MAKCAECYPITFRDVRGLSNVGKKMTFWSLISELSICIPIIQRDYIQGRNKDQVIDARRNLLREMRESIQNNGNLDLNFVYGKVHTDNGKSVFIPLDGQQRLTTLFLLHWFSFAQANDIAKADILKRFTYETRTSSRKFIEHLINNTDSLSVTVVDANQKISEQIRNEAWFWVEWSYDPTIDSMLLMLDEIKENFRGVDDLADKLTSGSAISFRFLNTFDLGMEDSLYIKLNARGRPLTDFENFKAELVKYVKKSAENGTMSDHIADSYAHKLDGKWTDMFWQWTVGDKEKFDKIYMNCFHWMLWNRWAEKQKQIEANYTITSAMNKTAYYRLKNYREYGAIDTKVLEDLYYTLDYFAPLVTDKGSKPGVSDTKGIAYLKKCSLDSGTAVTYDDRVMLTAVTSYVSTSKGVVASEAFGNWLRVLANLARNTRLDGLDDYIRAVQSIAELTNHSTDILTYLASPNCKLSGFLAEQIEEERLKAKLILRDDDWANAIYEAEDHRYFNGQIAFLLSFAGLGLETVDTIDDLKLSEYLKIFRVYLKKVSTLFSSKGLNVDPNLFSRAVLSKGDYLLSYKRNKSFLIGTHRDISWRNLLRNSNAVKRNFFKSVLDELDENNLSEQNIKHTLGKITQTSLVNDWRHYFVKMDGLLKQCGYYRLIYISPEGRILLVSSQTTAGYNREYYTYVVYLKLKQLGLNPHYSPDRGQYGEMFIDKVDGKEIKVNQIMNQNKEWEFEISHDGIKRNEKTVDDTTNYISTLL